MPLAKQTPDPKAVLIGQIQMLQTALDEHEKSWSAMGFSSIPNPVAERLRADIAEKKLTLALNQQSSAPPAEPDPAAGSVTGRA